MALGYLIFFLGIFSGIIINYTVKTNTYKTINSKCIDDKITFKIDDYFYFIENDESLYEENEEVIIYYDINNPEKNFTEKEKKENIVSVIPITLILLIIWIILFIVLRTKAKKEKYIIKNGKKVKAIIIDIVRVNEANDKYVYLKCEYDPIFDNKYYFSSQKIYSNKIYKSKFTKGLATIYYMSNNTGEYVVTDCELR